MINPITTVILLSSIIWGISALPRSDIRIRKGKFSIPAIRSDLLINNRIKKLQRSNKGFGPELWDRNNSLLTTRQDGSVVAGINPGPLWTATVTVGGQDLSLVIDSGSSNLWVYSSLQPPEQLDGHSYYDPSKSNTFVDMKTPFTIGYADGTSAEGDIGADTVTIGGTTVDGQEFGLAENVGDPSESLDGVVGLGFSSVIEIGTSTFLNNALPSLTDGLFAAYLPRNGIGAFSFGEVDETKYRGPLAFADVNIDSGVWLIDSDAFMFGGISQQEEGLTGVMDTGSTAIYLIESLALQYYESGVEGWQFNGKYGGYIFPCEATLPDFSFKIGPDVYATIPGSDLTLITVIPNPPTCLGAIQTKGTIYNIYGLPFFKNYYAIFNQADQQFGFASIN